MSRYFIVLTLSNLVNRVPDVNKNKGVAETAPLTLANHPQKYKQIFYIFE